MSLPSHLSLAKPNISCLEGQIASDVAESSSCSRLADRIQNILALSPAEAFRVSASKIKAQPKPCDYKIKEVDI